MSPRLLIALLFLPLVTLHAAPEGTAGPLVGAIEPDRVTLWMFAPAESQCLYTYHSDGLASTNGGGGQIAVVPTPAADGPGRLHAK